MPNRALITVGTAHSQPGEITYGELRAVELPSGGYDALPIIIAQGKRATASSPVLWLTASIHGAEYTGIPVIHRLLTSELLERLKGTIIAVPTLNPAGLRTAERSAYYLHGYDPNRLFPSMQTRRNPSVWDAPPLAVEETFQTLFAHIQQTGHYLIDLHNYSLGALSFAFRDPIFYKGGRDRVGAQALQQKLGEMLEAFGHTIVNEYVSNDYLRLSLHRSVSGAALNTARIPAFTAELGGFMTIDPEIVKAALSGVRNVLRWAKMLDGDPEPITSIKVIKPDYAVRRLQHPHAPRSGICEFFVKAGDVVNSGSPVARITDIYGRPLGEDDGLVRTDHDGFVLGLSVGAVCYRHEQLISLAVRDDSALVLPYPT